MERKIILIILISFCYISVSAQIPVPDSYLLSPNAASLGQYGEVPVSLYTGTVQINVPIYEIDYMGHKIPISMTYHGSGVRPDQHPGWVGLGWNLNAGGCISRIVNGLPDETYRENTIYTDYRAMGYFYTTEIYEDIIPAKPENMTYLGDDNLLYQFYYQEDAAPDEFRFDFLGISGSFYLSKEGEWVIRSKEKIKVIFDLLDEENYFRKFNNPFIGNGVDVFRNHYSKTIRGFKIIDKNGTEYTFGQDLNAVEFSVGLFSQMTESIAASTWHLKSIKYVNGATIDFNYQKKEFVIQAVPSAYKMMISAVYNTYSKTIPEQNLETYSGSLISPSYLTEIRFGNNKVNFDIAESKELRYDFVKMVERNFCKGHVIFDQMPYLESYEANGEYRTQRIILYDNNSVYQNIKWYKLTNISVENGNGKVIKNVRLNYNDENVSTQYTQRLALMSITDINTGGKYQFEYNDIGGLPPYCNGQTDHWGFYNGNVSNILGYNRFLDTYYYTIKNSNAEAMKKGMLTKIEYPTGGYNRFEYEANNYSRRVELESPVLTSYGTNQIAGGVRVKKIYNSPTGLSDDEFMAKRYYYTDDLNETKSSGILIHHPIYHVGNFRVISFQVIAYNLNIWSSQSVLTCSGNSSGTHLGYSKVIEQNADGSYSKYYFTDYMSNPDIFSITSMLNYSFHRPKAAMDQCRGLLKMREEYDSNGNLKKLVTNDFQNNTPLSTVISCRTQKVYILDTPYAFIEEASYPIYLYEMLPKKEVVTTYEQGGDSIVNTTTYSYNSHGLVSKVVKTLNHGVSEQTLIKYPTDFPDSTVYANFQERHILSPVVEQIIQRVDSVGNTSTVSRLFNHYSSDNPVFPYAVDMAIGNNPYENRHKYRFGEYLNPVAEIKDNGNETVYIWGYNHQYIVAVIEGSYYNEVCGIFGTPNSFATSLTPDFTKLYDFRDRFVSRSRVTIYEYDPLVGVTKKILPDGSSISYHYDSAGRLSHTTDSEGKVIEVYDYNFR
ncbi:MAG: hypothetical protein E7079_01445 [Bacteroidales bacterium]|nr:hypothetical protein [Bacteroidales bacterium]